MLVPRGPDGRIGWPDDPSPCPPQQSCPQPSFWDVVQKVSLLVGLAPSATLSNTTVPVLDFCSNQSLIGLMVLSNG